MSAVLIDLLDVDKQDVDIDNVEVEHAMPHTLRLTVFHVYTPIPR